MEHLPCPEGIRYEIPYLGAEEFDGGDFATYPERRGWDKHKIFARKPTRYDPGDLEAFLQTWLYFGLLTCTFRTVGIIVKTDDFVRTDQGRKLITTERLPDFLDEWNSRENIPIIRDRGGDPSEAIKVNGKLSRWPVILAVLYEVHDYVNRFCNEQGQLFSKELQLAEDLFRPISPSWGTSSLLTQRLFAKGLCPKDVALLTYDYARTIDLQYYARCMPYSRGTLEHIGCTDTACSVDKVVEETYVTTHLHPECECTHVEVSRDIVSIIERGGIPLVSFQKIEAQNNYQLRVLEYEVGPCINKYVAISHVWSDGMGNLEKNSLPACRLSQIQAQVERLYDHKEDDFPHGGYRYRKSQEPLITWDEFYATVKAQVAERTYAASAFWMDTLCVPVQEADKPFRELAIRNMANVYRNADRVLVIDSWIQGASRKDHVNERSARIYMSNWQRRLWTLQERILAKNLYFQYRDGPQHRDDLMLDLGLDRRFGRGYYHSIGLTGIAGLSTLRDFFGEDEGSPFPRFDALAISLCDRTTSRPSDETVCLASMLGLDTRPLQIIDSKKADERMACFLRMVNTFRPHRIFDAGPRCAVNGFGWAPSSFLNRTDPLSPADYGDDEIRFAGLAKNGGLIVSYSGVLLGTAGHLLNLNCGIFFAKDHTKGLVVQFRRSEIGKEMAPWDRSKEYAVVSYKPLESLLDEPDSQSIGIIGTLNRGASFDGFEIKHVCRATLLSLDEEFMRSYEPYWTGGDVSSNRTGDGGIIEGELLDEKQQWCVV